MDAGTYEVLRGRLAEQAAELVRRAEALNGRRLEAFGGTELRLLGTERLRTDNSCLPRDLVSVGGLLLVGYDVFIGLKPETTVGDVFSLHRFAGADGGLRFEPAGLDAVPGLLTEPAFERDFAELFRYYRATRLLQLRRIEGRLLAVFQTGERTEDVKVLRWSVAADGTVSYLDSRGERDHRFPPQHDFEWVQTSRDDHVQGRHPHIAVGGEVFVEALGGDLTIKIENNTETGAGIYTEPVDEPLQSLADADVHWARIGPLILLRIRPYKETGWRHLVFNTRTREVVRLDGIGAACQRLPDDQGLIFPGGYYLATGVAKTFDTDVSDLEFERVVRSTNGEDVLYVFHARAAGRTLLLPYNVIRKEVATPIPCHGYSLFDDGTLVVFRAADEPSRVHPLQVWQTPYLADTFAAAQPVGTGPLERVGNADLVRGIADCLSTARAVGEMAPSAAVFESLISGCTRIEDHYHWLGEAELGDLRTPLAAVRATAEQVLDEYEAVQELTGQAAAAVSGAADELAVMVRRVRAEAPKTADEWVRLLADLRRTRGRLIGLRDLRYVDSDRIDELASAVDGEVATAGKRAVAFLTRPDAFAGYRSDVDGLVAEGAALPTAAAALPLVERIDAQVAGLRTITEVVGSLDIADATVRTEVLERVGEVLGGLNRARATVDGRRRSLLASEGRAEFAAELGLLGQAITAGLAAADTPAACDEQLSRLLLQLENLESRFAEFDDFLAELATRRTDAYEVFSARKQTLLDERARRTDRLVDSARRILSSVTRRAGTLGSLDEVNTYFAGDPLVAKVRAVAEELRGLGDAVRAEELAGALLAARQEAGRALRDRLDLFTDGGETIRLGRHRFAVNTQPVDLTLVPADDGLAYAVTGTDYRAPVRDAAFAATKPYWDQLLVSETAEVYRAEYLAASILDGGKLDGDPLELVRRAAETRYDEGYQRGVHDADAARILAALLPLHADAGLLRYPAPARAAAQLFWAFGAEQADGWAARAGSLARARAAFGPSTAVQELSAELGAAIGAFLDASGLDGYDPELAGEYLFEELATTPFGFVTGRGARHLLDRFAASLPARSGGVFAAELATVPDLAGRHQLARAWLTSYLADAGQPADDLAEAVAIELCGPELPRRESAATLSTTVDGLLGTHPRIAGGTLELRLDELLARTRRFRAQRVPAYRNYQRQRDELVGRERARLRLDELQPRVMSAFVRNRLLDEVYLPLIGDNLAKQLGAAGDAKRTDQMGLLLLISPPGYGKTTLMEYVAGRLGLVFVKVNGAALGSEVTSIDPADAPDATARREVEKISFALELGSNTLLYLDDIQHTSPELLQKFVSLCDAQRRMEGVWDGAARTYDLRGKRFAVCMAGNPYTESGQRFAIPDMLANRADVWNLGDVLTGRDDLFALSYIENALTANPVLAPLSTRDRGDVELLVRLARGDESVRPDQLTHPYPPTELAGIRAVLTHLLHVQETVSAVNQAYIASAAQSGGARTEPPFGLQGSYRDMARLAERIVPVMNTAELDAVIDDHYRGEAQTLTTGAEANLLKLAELRGTLTPAQARRWSEVKTGYLRERALGGSTDDPLTRAVGAVGLLADRVAAVESAITHATDRLADRQISRG